MASSELLHRPLRLERVESVAADATVRHVDQLDRNTLEAFYEALADERPISEGDVNLEPGEIIVFTDYYRVERS